MSKFKLCKGLLHVSLVLLLISSCNLGSAKSVAKQPAAEEYVPSVNEAKSIEDFKTNFGKSVFLTVQAAKDIYNTLNANGYVDEGNSLDGRRTRGELACGLVSLEDVGKRFASKRGAQRKARSAEILEDESVDEDDNGALVEVELAEISENYRKEVASLVPDYEDGTLAGYMTISDGKIYIGGDVVANVGSPESIALIETYNRVNNGEDLYSVVEDIQNDVNQLIEEENYSSALSRALYVNPDLGSGAALSFKGVYATYERWTNGEVFYQWDGMSEGQKEVARKAMTIWQEGTDNEVTFTEIQPNAWDWTMYALGQKNWVLMQSDNNVWGESLIGAGWGSYLKLNPVIDAVDFDEDIGVACHELGHVLGFSHEFQRPDRDDYCIVDNDFINGASGVYKIANYDKMPSQAIVVGVKKVKIWFVTVYIPYIWYYDYAKTFGDFDYDSVMQYKKLKLKLRKEALDIVKRDRYSCYPRISVSFIPKNDVGLIASYDELLDRLCTISKVEEIKKDAYLQNYDIRMTLRYPNTRPSRSDFNAIKKLY